MTPIEKHMFKTIEYLDKLGLRTFLIGSTLLQIMREGELQDRHQFDRELNLGCRAENFTPKMLEKIMKDFSMFQTHPGLILFGNQKESFWEKEGSYFSLLGFFRKRGQVRYEDMGLGNYLVWPKSHLERLSSITYKRKKIYVPNNPEKWLETYYGASWRRENLSWTWAMAENLKQSEPNEGIGEVVVINPQTGEILARRGGDVT